MASTVRIGDLTVNRLGFGAMRACGTNIWGSPKNRAAPHTALRRACDLGLNFFDTADSYGPHVSEELIAEALSPRRAACCGNLKRLKLERIDLYQLHTPDAKGWKAPVGFSTCHFSAGGGR